VLSTHADFASAVHQQLAHGFRFAHGNVNIYCLQMYDILFDKDIKIDQQVPHLKDCRPLDQAYSIIVHAHVTIDDSSNPTLIAQASSELLKLKDDFEGCINFQVPDRPSLDTRYRG
jgi:mediator of RNA polymerase II transcription subunit 18, fungi type